MANEFSSRATICPFPVLGHKSPEINHRSYTEFVELDYQDGLVPTARFREMAAKVNQSFHFDAFNRAKPASGSLSGLKSESGNNQKDSFQNHEGKHSETSDSENESSRARGTRTPNQRIMSSLL